MNTVVSVDLFVVGPQSNSSEIAQLLEPLGIEFRLSGPSVWGTVAANLTDGRFCGGWHDLSEIIRKWLSKFSRAGDPITRLKTLGCSVTLVIGFPGYLEQQQSMTLDERCLAELGANGINVEIACFPHRPDDW